MSHLPASQQQLIEQGLTRKRAYSVSSLARAVADQTIRLDIGSNPHTVMESLRALPEIGPWTAQYIAMRALSDPDAFPHSDLGLLRALDVNLAGELLAISQAWRPWRAYAAMHLWNTQAAGG